MPGSLVGYGSKRLLSNKLLSEILNEHAGSDYENILARDSTALILTDRIKTILRLRKNNFGSTARIERVRCPDHIQLMWSMDPLPLPLTPRQETEFFCGVENDLGGKCEMRVITPESRILIPLATIFSRRKNSGLIIYDSDFALDMDQSIAPKGVQGSTSREKGWAIIPPMLQAGEYLESGVKYSETPRKEYFRILSVQPHQLVVRTATRPPAKPTEVSLEIEQAASAIKRNNMPVELLYSNRAWN